MLLPTVCESCLGKYNLFFHPAFYAHRYVLICCDVFLRNSECTLGSIRKNRLRTNSS